MMNNPYLLPGLKSGPLTVARIVRSIPERLYDHKTDPDRFSLREAVCHLADWEQIHLARMQAGLTQEDAPVHGIDEGARAEELGYATWNVEEQLSHFASERQKTIDFLKGLSPDQWKTTVVHSEKGRLTLYDQANVLLAHDTYHIDHLSQYLELA
jgi:hypothetical protein